ncbi:MAG TPA: calcium/proton exchanger [Gemmatimonadales bacterium]|nr:calcium/proton exchanger [Gemmatimonadales bacterium]
MTEPGSSPSEAALVEAARAEAVARGSDAISAEHLLLVALATPEAEAALTSAGIAPSELRQRVEAGLRAGKGETPPEALALSSQGRRLAAAAEREAAARSEPASTSHLLLAAFAEPRGSLARALADLGVSPRALRAAAHEATGLAPLPREQRQGERQPAREAEPQETAPPAEAAGDTPSEPAEPRNRRARGERRRERASGEKRVERQREPRASAGTAAAPVPAPPAAADNQVKPRRPLKHLRKDPDAWGPIWRRLLLLAVPAALWANYSGQEPLVVFLLSCAGVVPLAGFMGDATEHLAAHTGPTVGGLLNATFGNAAELIIGLMALRAGEVELVKYSITGSILGNLLLIMGLSLVAGGLRTSELRFSRTASGMSAGMLAAAVVGLVFPALLHASHPAQERLADLRVSEAVAVVLIITYGFSLLFTLKTHKWLMSGDPHEMPRRAWSVGKAVAVLAIATACIAVLSEMLVHSVQGAGSALGLGTVFVGLIIIPIIGNAAEHASAILMARRGKMDLSLQIAYGSSTQIALLVAPVLVFAGVLMGQDMNLVFEPFEVMAVGLAVIVTAIGTTDGESHWFEGVMLLAVYALMAIAAYFV